MFNYFVVEKCVKCVQGGWGSMHCLFLFNIAKNKEHAWNSNEGMKTWRICECANKSCELQVNPFVTLYQASVNFNDWFNGGIENPDFRQTRDALVNAALIYQLKVSKGQAIAWYETERTQLFCLLKKRFNFKALCVNSSGGSLKKLISDSFFSVPNDY